jgi:hypothetical protein
VVMLIDFGLMDLWTHDRPPLIPPGVLSDRDLNSANNGADFKIEGPDALAAGKKFDRQPHPLYLYDIARSNVEELKETFDAFVLREGFRCRLLELPARVPPLTRAGQAIEQGGGAGEVFLHGMHTIVVGGIPPDKILQVEGRHMEDGPFASHWRDISLVLNPGAEIAASRKVGHVAVEMARLMFCDLQAAGKWQHLDSTDGLADYIFWGKDAFRLARRFGAPLIKDNIYGFADKPMTEMLTLAIQVEKHLEHHRLVAATDFRPHSDHWRMLNTISDNDTESGEIELDGSLCCGFMTSWGDGFFPVYLDYNSLEELSRIRIDLGTEETLKGMRMVNRYSQ